jgi:hypothetical protein
MAAAVPAEGGMAAAVPAEGGMAADAEARLRLAGHLAELAWLAAPGDPEVAQVRQRVFSRRADKATSTMAKGVFRWTADESVAGG